MAEEKVNRGGERREVIEIADRQRRQDDAGKMSTVSDYCMTD